MILDYKEEIINKTIKLSAEELLTDALCKKRYEEDILDKLNKIIEILKVNNDKD